MNGVNFYFVLSTSTVTSRFIEQNRWNKHRNILKTKTSQKSQIMCLILIIWNFNKICIIILSKSDMQFYILFYQISVYPSVCLVVAPPPPPPTPPHLLADIFLWLFTKHLVICNKPISSIKYVSLDIFFTLIQICIV